MTFLTTLANFFKGTYAKFGTSANLVREVSLSILTAVTVATLVQLLTPATPSPVAEVRALTTDLLRTQHQADSILNQRMIWLMQDHIDSLETELQERDEQDSLRANAGLSNLDAMRKINGSIHPAGSASQRR